MTISFSPRLGRALILCPFRGQRIIYRIANNGFSSANAFTGSIRLHWYLKGFVRDNTTFYRVRVRFYRASGESQLILLFFYANYPYGNELGRLLQRVSNRAIITIRREQIMSIGLQVTRFRFRELSTVGATSRIATIGDGPNVRTELATNVRPSGIATINCPYTLMPFKLQMRLFIFFGECSIFNMRVFRYVWHKQCAQVSKFPNSLIVLSSAI